MKIAIVHHQYQCKGGMERYLFDLIDGFRAAGDTVDLYVYKRDKNLEIPEGLTVKQTKLGWLPRKLKKYVFTLLMKRVEWLEYDLSISLMASWGQDLMMCGGSHLAYLRDLNKKPGPWGWMRLYFEQRGFNEAKHIVAHSKRIAEDLLALYPLAVDKVKMLYPPIDAGRFNRLQYSQREGLRTTFGCTVGKVTLVIPSTGHKRKGTYELIEAMKLLPEEQFELLIAGDPIETVAGNIRSLGFVDDMPGLYTAADFMVLPSHSEPFGLVVPEALACGTPVIISNRVGAKELITDDLGVVIDEITPAAIARAIQQVAQRKFNISNAFIHHYQLARQVHIEQLKCLL
ncbi:Mannosylfructose-phosphate synthase [Piscirickettsia salmonis]|uniref:glycosyltransferase family 4 protein n=1 Tax=Piscirickettsia salmonis TaxID=1238 RepID=UPI0012BA0CB0|nr:glycosyltransferase family 4 protein [Piscirickettsia salmonis]QGP49097.1 Mannosylfructose-phosphate synthase [Piscirickettsia salmonis]QGP56147.1 Mannosylfructose-phosphate synthase [Piscirickettsia salmonis]QGP57985.1 Mannosylfructose-phosphate synthase [Piscirickettsia salmonis]QGP65716.1 Mannosylfructose-phosphate synthase [Piscirickettsia salmonis]